MTTITHHSVDADNQATVQDAERQTGNRQTAKPAAKEYAKAYNRVRGYAKPRARVAKRMAKFLEA